MSFKSSAAHSSRIKKTAKPPAFKRNALVPSPYADLPRRKPQRARQKPVEEEEDYLDERLDDIGLVKALAADLTLRDVAQAITYIRSKMWCLIPQQRTGMSAARVAEVFQYRATLPPIVTVSHVQALLNSPTTVEREIAELARGGAIRKIVVGGRGSLGELLILTKDLDEMIQGSGLDDALKEKFISLLREHPTALSLSRSKLSPNDAKTLIRAGFLTSSTPSWTTTDVFSTPGDGSRGTLTSLHSVSKAASGSMAAVGGEGAVHAAGGSGGRGAGRSDPAPTELRLAVPSMGSLLKLLASARTHLVALLSKTASREVPESVLRQRWEGGVEVDDAAGLARRSRGKFAGVLPGRTRKWKAFYGISYEWILGECVGAGLVEVFDTRSVGRGVRAM